MPSEPCTVPDCKVAYWEGVLDRGEWSRVANDYDDARSALASAELLCRVMHRPPPPPPLPLPCPKCGGELRAKRNGWDSRVRITCASCAHSFELRAD